MSRVLPVALLVVLSTALLGGSCEDAEAVSLEELREDVAPPFDYSLYCDDNGTLVGERSAVLLVHRSAHLERVYADAQAGDTRAQALFEQLERTVQRSGGLLAEQASGLVCSSAPACSVKWHFLEELMPSRGPGGMRLREQLADSFSRQAKLQGVRNAVITGALTVLLATTVVKGEVAGATKVEAGAAEARAGAIEAGRLALGGVEARLAVEEVAALEARMVEAEALEVAARHPARLEVLARYRPSASQPPSGVSADSPRPLTPGHIGVKPPLTWENYSALIQLERDAVEARTKYSGTVEVRRPGHPLFGKTVDISRVHLVYDGENLLPALKDALSREARQFDINLHFHDP